MKCFICNEEREYEELTTYTDFAGERKIQVCEDEHDGELEYNWRLDLKYFYIQGVYYLHHTDLEKVLW